MSPVANSNLDETPLLAQGGAELSIVIPTFNESANIPLIVDEIRSILGRDLNWEVVFVDDDSPDQTSGVARQMALFDRRVRIVRRVGRRGLSTAVVEGILSTSAPYVIVMDADLQHDTSLLPRMLIELRTQHYDVVVGSRYVDGGGMGAWEEGRQNASRLATRIASLVVRAPVKDVMSGFFGIRRDAFDRVLPRLSNMGFKILLDLFASSPEPLRFKEVPYTFKQRIHGDSKLDTLVLWEYLLLLFDKKFGHIIPARFVSFSVIGVSGIAVHFAVLTAMFQVFHRGFAVAEAVAALTAMTWNFALNNMLTYRDRRLSGWGLLRGWAVFVGVCSFGAVANVGIANWLYEGKFNWAASALAGVVLGSVWNYVMSSMFSWRTTAART
ncbi:MAG TPA: glycosyltransferase family 2 protein [Caulobacterales bacterium]|nr:glycosyltransferase family 2 protein [Caulobacterales bacterium]